MLIQPFYGHYTGQPQLATSQHPKLRTTGFCFITETGNYWFSIQWKASCLFCIQKDDDGGFIKYELILGIYTNIVLL